MLFDLSCLSSGFHSHSWIVSINCLSFLYRCLDYRLFCLCHPLFWCSRLSTTALSFLGPFSAFWDVIDIERSISIAFQLCRLFCCLVDCWGRPSLSNNPAVHWLLSSAALGPSLSSSLFLVSFVSWKLRGCDRWWNYDIIYRIPVLSVIYHLVDHRGCFLLTTQWFTDSCFSATLGLLSSHFVPLSSCFLGCDE